MIILSTYVFYFSIYFTVYFATGGRHDAMAMYLVPLGHFAWLYGRKGGFIGSIFGVVIDVTLVLFLGDLYVLGSVLVQSGIYYPIYGIGIGYMREIILKLRQAHKEIETLREILPICANCKQIRDDKGYWHQVDEYLRENNDIVFSHGICPKCEKELYGDLLNPESNDADLS